MAVSDKNITIFNLYKHESIMNDFGDVILMIGSKYKLAPGSSGSIQSLKERIVSIIDANQWLMSNKLKTKKEDLKLCLRKNQDPNGFIEEIKEEEMFDKNKKLMDLSEVIWKHRHNKDYPKDFGNKCSPFSPMFKFIIIRNHLKTEMWLVLSISHVYADGGTMYDIWKMLDPKMPIISLDPIRKSDEFLKEIVEKHTGLHPEEGCSMLDNQFKMQDLFCTLYRSISRKIRGKFNPSIKMFALNMDYIASEKSRFGNAVSTNDIVVTWFLNLGRKLSPDRHVKIPVNILLRLPEEHNLRNSAGNHVQMVTFSGEQLETPINFRKRLMSIIRKEEHAKDLPFSQKREFSGCLATNWTTFYHEADVDGWIHDFHGVFTRREQLIFKLCGMSFTDEQCLVVFRYDKDRMAVLIVKGEYPKISDEELKKEPILDFEI